LARELGVDLARVKGTGMSGRIFRADVQAFVKSALAQAKRTGAASPLELPAWPKPDFARFGEIERKPLSRIRRLAKSNLARNWVMIPHVTQFDEADVTDLEAFRREINRDAKDGLRVTILAFVLKALVAALTEFPDFNASLDGEELILRKYFHLGFAADTPEGLVVPVIREVDKKGVVQIARETAALANAARDRKLKLGDIQGGCFTVSSLGGIGGTAFTPIINAPEVAILGISKLATRPVWRDGAFVPRLTLPLSLSYDHRVIDGAVAARFTTYLAGVLSDMRRALL
jgi:pyruvate dehydrogenase E2 component (dihydrolipoamide acetyltransferase)